MKVGFDIRPALFNFAGIGRYVRELGIALTNLEDGPFMEMFAPSWRSGSQIPESLNAKKHKIHRGFLPGRIMSQLNKIPGLDAGRFPAKVDVFHWTDYSYPTVKSCATIMTLHDAAFAVNPTFHGWETSNLLDRVRHMLNQADVVIVPSEPSANDAELLGVDPENVKIIPHGVAAHFFSPSENVKKEYLLTIGTIEPRKNYVRTLKAFEYLWDRDLAPNWIIVGAEGWDHEEFCNLIETSKHRKKIRWIKHVNDKKLIKLYQGALALIHSSLHEGFGLPVLEAMATQTAVVVSKGTSAEWVAGDACMKVNPRSVDSIAEGIERIVNEEWWRNHAASVLQKRARQFTWKRSAKQTKLAYECAIKKHTSKI